MEKLSGDILHFLKNQSFMIVSTVDKNGTPHSACKGIVDVEPDGKIYLLDLYMGGTFENLKGNDHISITAVDEHKFKGYCLKGKARIIRTEDVRPQVIKAWEEKVTTRITQRVIRNMREEKGHPRHPEALLPKPAYMILMETHEVVDLTPHHIRKM
ncbi:MAG: pyridoxamine 5'-phosphate oxidase family protein [Candidatus Omnitrophica bacterium]|nr:pyridoxamine 5'-phosphate oxidase family protein [Candidatus Omnitrophota bacterium]